MKAIVFVGVLFHLFINSFASGDEIQNVSKANIFYEQGKYDKAMAIYQMVAEKSSYSGKIYFNLGNTYYRLGDLGKAIYYYRKAFELRPRDGDVEYNLMHARKKRPDNLGERDLSIIDKFFPFSNNEVLILVTCLSFLFWTSVIILLFKELNWLKNIRNVSLLVLLLFSIPCSLRIMQGKNFGVITKNTVKIYSSIGRDSVVLFTLEEGAEFTLLDKTKSDWAQIRLADGKKGWVSKNDIIF